MELYLPELSVNMVVTSPYHTLPHITPNKHYIISKMDQDIVWVRNDYGLQAPYKGIHFIEVDIYYSLLLYTTLMRTLSLIDKPFKSFDN